MRTGEWGREGRREGIGLTHTLVAAILPLPYSESTYCTHFLFHCSDSQPLWTTHLHGYRAGIDPEGLPSRPEVLEEGKIAGKNCTL